jgi:hypothetical protein
MIFVFILIQLTVYYMSNRTIDIWIKAWLEEDEPNTANAPPSFPSFDSFSRFPAA